MKLILIAGGKRSGKSHVMLYLAKLMANAGLNVIAVDATKDADILSFFNLNRSIEDRFSLDEMPSITREGFDILACKSRFNLKQSESLMEDRDIFLLETDRIFPLPNYVLSHIILLQNMDVSNLYALRDLTQQIANAHPSIPASFVLNNYLHCKLSLTYICSTLGLQAEQFHVIPFHTGNIIHDINSRVDGRLKLKGFTREHNQAVFALFCELTGSENSRKIFKQLIY